MNRALEIVLSWLEKQGCYVGRDIIWSKAHGRRFAEAKLQVYGVKGLYTKEVELYAVGFSEEASPRSIEAELRRYFWFAHKVYYASPSSLPETTRQRLAELGAGLLKLNLEKRDATVVFEARKNKPVLQALYDLLYYRMRLCICRSCKRYVKKADGLEGTFSLASIKGFEVVTCLCKNCASKELSSPRSSFGP